MPRRYIEIPVEPNKLSRIEPSQRRKTIIAYYNGEPLVFTRLGLECLSALSGTPVKEITSAGDHASLRRVFEKAMEYGRLYLSVYRRADGNRYCYRVAAENHFLVPMSLVERKAREVLEKHGYRVYFTTVTRLWGRRCSYISIGYGVEPNVYDVVSYGVCIAETMPRNKKLGLHGLVVFNDKDLLPALCSESLEVNGASDLSALEEKLLVVVRCTEKLMSWISDTVDRYTTRSTLMALEDRLEAVVPSRKRKYVREIILNNVAAYNLTVYALLRSISSAARFFASKRNYRKKYLLLLEWLRNHVGARDLMYS